MSLKMKLTSTIMAFFLLTSMLIVGVFAVKQTQFSVGGNIEFNAKGIEATIALSNTGLTNIELPEGINAGNQVFAPITITNSTTAEEIRSQFAKWTNLNLTFTQDQSMASIELVITNTSTDQDNYIDITALADATTKNNAKIIVRNNAGGITALLKSGENATFTITFSVIDDECNASLSDFNVSFNMQKLSESDFSETVEGLSINKYPDTKTATITGLSIYERIDLVIPKYVLNVDGDTKTICAVTSIGEYGLAGGGFDSLILPDTLTTIKGMAFYTTYVKNITLPNSVTDLEETAFYSCQDLISIIIPDSVTNIGNRAFSGCYGLTSIIIPDSVTSIGEGVFSDCRNLASIIVERGNRVYDSRNNCNAIIETATNKLIQGCNGSFIPNTITSIGNYSFYCCMDLTSITIPNSVYSIGDWVFSNCTSLTSITIPDGVTSIGEYVFDGCRALTSITIPDSVLTVGTQSFGYCENLESVDLGNSITEISDAMFMNLTSLKSVNLGSRVESIANDAFYGCSALTNITIPNGVVSIGMSAFGQCSSLTNIEIPDSVSSMGSAAFVNCTSLETVIIGSGINIIDEQVFGGCSSLKSVVINKNLKSIGYAAFGGCQNLTNVYFTGTQDEWNSIEIFSMDNANDAIINATKTYNYVIE